MKHNKLFQRKVVVINAVTCGVQIIMTISNRLSNPCNQDGANVILRLIFSFRPAQRFSTI